MISSIIQAQSLVDVLEYHAATTPDKIAYGYLTNGDDLDETITFAELARQARAFAAALQETTSPGDRALLLYPSGLDFIVAFLGCFYAGVIAVPTTVPHLKRATPRLKLMLEDAKAKVACTKLELLDRIKSAVGGYPEFQNLEWVVNEKYNPGYEINYRQHEQQSGDLAFLQYTSGSTSAPKGVMISHWNLIRTIQDLQIAEGSGPKSVTTTWLPVFHDMGLILGLLTPLYTNSPSYIISPVTFLEKPTRWLKLITRFKATHTAAPNFAYDLCARKITDEEKSLLDLRTLKVAVNAAEPVRLETMNNFSRAFEGCGFNEHAFSPGYGLAEATVMVSLKLRTQATAHCSIDPELLKENRLVFLPENDPRGYKSVGCGWSAIGADIRIVNPKTGREAPSDEIGEIWVKSDSVAQGYLDKPEENKETFQARLADTNEGPFLRTGDMGFIHDGQLHIAGRIKDMIIIQGRNYYPQDIELGVVKCHPALRPHCGAAFGLQDDQAERLVLVQEVKREYRKSNEFLDISNLIRQAIAKNHGLRAHAVVLIMPSTIPKTTSGKIQRSAARESFLNGQLEVLYEWRAPGAFEDIVSNPSLEKR